MSVDSRFKLAGTCLLLCAIVTATLTLPVQEHLLALLQKIEKIGPWGAVWISLIYIPACLFFIPGSLITAGAGFAFGLLIGTIAVSVGSTVGATAAFLAGRTIARDWIAAKVVRSPKFHAIDRAVGENGFKIVLLTRLSPVFPFNLLNYAFGLTGVSLKDYIVASWIGMLPGTIMYVYIGTTLKNISDMATGYRQPTTIEQTLFYAGLSITLLIAILITRIANRALQQAVPASRANDISTTDAIMPDQ